MPKAPDNIAGLLPATTSSGGVVDGVDAGKPIISLKSARKLLGSDTEGVSDDYLLGVIFSIQQIAEALLVSEKVPKNDKVGV